MRKLLTPAFLIAISTAGAAEAQSRPEPAPGVTVQMLDTRRAHVTFTGAGGEQAVRRQALLSAAAMTLDQRGTWFRVDTEWVDGGGRGPTTVALEVKFGEGPTPQETNAFDAAEVVQRHAPLLQASR